jgi:HEAT repeat protein
MTNPGGVVATVSATDSERHRLPAISMTRDANGTMSNNPAATNARVPAQNATAKETSPEVRRLLGDSQSSDAVNRAYAAILCGSMADKSAPKIPFLITLLGDDTTLQWVVNGAPGATTSPREEAVKALGKIGKPAIEALLALCDKGDSTAKHSICEVLQNTTDAHAFDLLIQSLSNEYGGVRAGAARALGNIKDRRAVPALISALRNDGDASTRSCAASALGDIGATDAIKPLLDSFLGDNAVNVRVAALKSLGQLKCTSVEPIINALNDKSGDVRVSATSALGQLKDSRAVNPLIAAYRAASEGQMDWDRESFQGKGVHDLQIAILNSLGAIADPRATDFLASIWRSDLKANDYGPYRDSSSMMTFYNPGPAALTALGNIGGTKAVDELILALSNGQYQIRVSVAVRNGPLSRRWPAGPMTLSVARCPREYQSRAWNPYFQPSVLWLPFRRETGPQFRRLRQFERVPHRR